MKRANDILKSSELKQAICTRILGTSFKDVEKVMNSIIKGRKISQDEQDLLDLEEEVPEKFDKDDIEFNSKISSPQEDAYVSDIDREYRLWIEGLVTEYFREQEKKKQPYNFEYEMKQYDDYAYEYDTYSEEEVADLMKDFSSSNYK